MSKPIAFAIMTGLIVGFVALIFRKPPPKRGCGGGCGDEYSDCGTAHEHTCDAHHSDAADSND